MKNIKILLIFIILTTHLAAWAYNKAIFGKDNRKDWYEVQDKKIQEMAKSTAALIHRNNLIDQGAYYTLSSSSLRGLGFCPNENFINQLTAASCTGFLINSNTMATSANCIKSIKDCENLFWIFDYRMKFKRDKIAVVQKDSVYRCIEILERKVDLFSQNNYAIIKLEREVLDRNPLPIRLSKKAQKGMKLYSLGHSFGLPLKVIEDAHVIRSMDKFFLANIDSGLGSSGSPVINAIDHVVEGILVQTQLDSINNGGCKKANNLNDNKGESVTHMANIEILK